MRIGGGDLPHSIDLSPLSLLGHLHLLPKPSAITAPLEIRQFYCSQHVPLRVIATKWDLGTLKITERRRIMKHPDGGDPRQDRDTTFCLGTKFLLETWWIAESGRIIDSGINYRGPDSCSRDRRRLPLRLSLTLGRRSVNRTGFGGRTRSERSAFKRCKN